MSYLQGLFNVQFARLALGIEPAEIIDSVGEIGIFLHFAYDHSRTDCMLRPSGNKNGVTSMNWNGLKKGFQRAIFKSSDKCFLIHTWLQSKQDARAGFCRNDVPHLG